MFPDYESISIEYLKLDKISCYVIWLHFLTLKKPDSLPSKVAQSQTETLIPTEKTHTITHVQTHTQTHLTNTCNTHTGLWPHSVISRVRSRVLPETRRCLRRLWNITVPPLTFISTLAWTNSWCYNVMCDIIKVSKLFSQILLQTSLYNK